jgi:predicted Zn-dependent peptidase
VVAQPRLIEQARRLLLKHFLEFTRAEPSAEELSAAKTRLMNSLALAQLSRSNLAKSVNVCEIYGVDSSQVWDLQRDVMAIEGADVVAMAKGWFERHAIGVVLPGDTE